MGLTGTPGSRFRVSAPTIAQTLAGWGDLVEVVEPPSLRAELAQLGSELVAPVGEGADPARDETGRRSVTSEPG